MIQKLINQGYRLYPEYKGFFLTEKIQKAFIERLNLVVEHRKDLKLILVRNATSKDRLQTGK